MERHQRLLERKELLCGGWRRRIARGATDEGYRLGQVRLEARIPLRRHSGLAGVPFHCGAPGAPQ
jgi:hypothetical protein